METTFAGSRTVTVAAGAALALSAAALADAVQLGLGSIPVWDQEIGGTWPVTAMGLVHGAGYAVLAAALVGVGVHVDSGRRAVRVVRLLLVTDLALLAVAFLWLTVAVDGRSAAPDALGVVFGGSFALVLLLPVVLGALLLRRSDTRMPAAVLLATLPVLGATMVLGVLAPGWAHPGYVEAVVYTGLALLVMRVSPDTAPDERIGARAAGRIA